MKGFYISIAVAISSLFLIVNAQQIAILDQGFNTTLTNNGDFYNPMCFGGNESYLYARGQFPVATVDPNASSINTSLARGDQVAIFGINLPVCSSIAL